MGVVLSSTYVICLCSYFAVTFMAMLDRFSVIFRCRKTAWWSFAIVLMGKIPFKKTMYASISSKTGISFQWYPSP